MKSIRKFSGLIFFLISFEASAFDSYAPSFEDTAEFLTPRPEARPLDHEVWSYAFELITPDGQVKSLSSSNQDAVLKPASTMKLFTGWWAFKSKSRSDDYLQQMLSRSVNSMAEATSRSLGGVKAMKEFYKNEGLRFDPSNFNPDDGSGLSYNNKTSCGIEIQMLKLIKADKNYEDFKELLAQPHRSGTLRSRLTAVRGRAFAKTGTLNRTASLSGFLETKDGTIVFCVLSDYLSTSLSSARRKIDSMVLENFSKIEPLENIEPYEDEGEDVYEGEEVLEDYEETVIIE